MKEENNYFCKYGLLHHKPVGKDGEPTSNNGWIYLAYFYSVKGLPIITEMEEARRVVSFHECTNPYFILPRRLPTKAEPPISRDEIIGMYCTNQHANARLKLTDNNFYFSSKIKKFFKFSPGLFFKHLKILIKNRHERNFFWKNNLIGVYCLTYKLWWHDRYFINKWTKRTPSIFQWAWFQLYAFRTITSGKVYEQNVLWLQLKGLRSRFWIKYINHKKNFKEYFPEDHPVNQALTQ